MTVSLVGTIVNAADATTGFNAGNISGDDDFVEGSGAIGVKCSSALCEFYTTSISGGPYDFSSGGGEFEFHIICWFNTKSPITASGGLRIVVGDGTNRGHWYVDKLGFYKGGFTTAVVDSARNFDNIAAGSWTVGGNPAQLSNVTQVGGALQTTVSIMGSFNNVQVDQFTIGFGVRADGTGNSFEAVRAQDEDTSFWGWWSSAFGAFIGKGKLFIGPASGSATCTFSDTANAVIFADERVTAGFYEINIRGAGTDVTFSLMSISAADTSIARWSLTVQSDTNSLDDTNSVFSGADELSLSANTTLTGTALIGSNHLTQNGALIDSISVLAATNGDGAAFVECDDPENIVDSTFNFSDGHALEIVVTGTYTFDGNQFVGSFGADGTNDAMIWFNPPGGTGDLTLNITGGGTTPTVRNSSSGSVTLNNAVDVTISGVTEGAAVKVIADETVGTFTAGDTVSQGLADSNGEYGFSLNYEGAFGAGFDVIVRAAQQGLPNAAIQDDNGAFTDQTTNSNSATVDDMNLLPATPVANQDSYLFGHAEPFSRLKLDISTAGTGGFTITWQYWDGDSWENLTGVTDGTSSLSVLGESEVSWTVPGDWAQTTVNSQGPFFFVRALYTAGTVTIVPLGRKCKLDITRYRHTGDQLRTITSGGLSTTVPWVRDLISTF